MYLELEIRTYVAAGHCSFSDHFSEMLATTKILAMETQQLMTNQK